MGQWFDACEGWAETVTRIQMFSFSKPYMANVPGAFGILDTDTSFDPSDLTGLTIGMLRYMLHLRSSVAFSNYLY